jgi:hypothetical protein
MVTTPYIILEDIEVFQGSAEPLQWTLTDASGTAINLSGKTVQFVVWQSPDGGQTKTTLLTYDNATHGNVVVSGSSSNIVTVNMQAVDTKNLIQTETYFSLSNRTDNVPLVTGAYSVLPAQWV